MFLAEKAPVRYVSLIEFRPDDMASPRITRRTDHLPPNLEPNPGCTSVRPTYRCT
jgi:hypothetical protein